MSFFCPRIPSRLLHCLRLSCLLSFLLAVTFLRLSLFLTTLTILRSTGQYFGQHPSLGICLMFFSDCGFGGGRPWRWSALLIRGIHGQHELSVHQVRWCVSGFCTIKVLCCAHSIYTLWKEVPMLSPHLRGGSLCFFGILHKGNLSLSPPCIYLYDHLFVSI